MSRLWHDAPRHSFTLGTRTVSYETVYSEHAKCWAREHFGLSADQGLWVEVQPRDWVWRPR